MFEKLHEVAEKTGLQISYEKQNTNMIEKCIWIEGLKKSREQISLNILGMGLMKKQRKDEPGR